MDKPFQYQFEWDAAKARQNARTHRVTFERAATAFLDPKALTILDQEHGEDEERWITLGIDRTGTLVVISHTYCDETEISGRIRIISARRATRNEVKQYERK